MNRTEIFNKQRPLLMSIAYRMLGSRDDAEDAVQDAYLRWQSTGDEPESPKSYLATVVTRLCIDQLKSARVRRETYVGQWLPEPVVTEGSTVELAESLTMAFLVILESLGPAERAAFLLREVFDYDYPQIAQIVGQSEANCRQLVHRSRERIAARHHRYDATPEQSARITSRFLETTRDGDLGGLMALFAEDAVMVSDGGGKVRAAINPVRGADAVARFIMGVVRKNEGWNAVHTLTEINGQPAFLTTVDGQPIAATILGIRAGVIAELYIVVNPDKLAGITRSIERP
jgi:RNA polymerase sigma-70 factor (ECF subfamily)